MSKPAHKIRLGVLQVTIWRNHGEKGSWYSVIPSRSYKQGDDAWKETDSLGFDDLLTMAKLFDLAARYLLVRGLPEKVGIVHTAILPCVYAIRSSGMSSDRTTSASGKRTSVTRIAILASDEEEGGLTIAEGGSLLVGVGVCNEAGSFRPAADSQ